MKKEKIGGIALFNGLILRSKKSEVISKYEDGLIDVSKTNFTEENIKINFKKLPIIRGIFGIIDTLKNSASYVIESAKKVLDGLIDEDESIEIGKFEMAISYAIALVVIFSTLILLPNILSIFFDKNIQNVIQAIIQILIFVSYLVILKKTKVLNVLFEYHGAEHKVVNAYENYSFEDISVEKVKNSSRFHIRCGGNLVVYFFIINILFTLLFTSNSIIIKSIYQLILMAFSIGISYEIIMIFARLPKPINVLGYPAMLIQYITTKEPSEEKIKLALLNMFNCCYSDKEISINKYLRDINTIKDCELTIIVSFIASIKEFEYNYVYANIQEINLNINEIIKLDNMITKYYIKKIPFQYITSYQNFFNERYFVNESVLIPRADTEILVEKAIEYIDKYNLKSMIDVCTGSGCVGISISKNSNIEKTILIDISAKALEVTNKNIISNSVLNKCSTLCSDLFNSLYLEENSNLINGKYDIVVSNPPYIPTADINGLSEDVKKEPRIALDGGIDGMNFYKKILIEAKNVLKIDGFLLFEIGYDELNKIHDLIESDEDYELLESVKDYGGNDRVVVCRLHQI